MDSVYEKLLEIRDKYKEEKELFNPYNKYIKELNLYLGKKILCIKDFHYTSTNTNILVASKGQYYSYIILGNKIQLMIKGCPIYIDNFFNYFRLITQSELRKEKINKILS